MKKFYILMLILALAFAMGIAKLDKENKNMGIIVLNVGKISDFSQRSELKKCLLGETGRFEKPLEITLFTHSEQIDKYRYIKGQIENWGGKCVLKKESRESIFDFRALGALSMYVWEGDKDDIYEAFLSKNSQFYSTGYQSLEYDEMIANGQFELAEGLLNDNISIIEV